MASKKPMVDNSGMMSEINSTDQIPTSNLGTGTANSTTYLRGDGTWTTISGGSTISGLTTNYLTKATSTTTIGDSGIYDNGSNRMGFRTGFPVSNFQFDGGPGSQSGEATLYHTSTGYTLVELYGDSASQFRMRSSGINTLLITNPPGNSTISVAYEAMYGLSFGSNAGETMRLTYGGNVGIGTSTPNNKLEVVGNILATNFSGTHSGASSNTNTGDQTLSISGSTLTISGGTGNSVTLPASGTTYNVTNNSNTTRIDQSPVTTPYGSITGTINGSTTIFTVSNGSYQSGSLRVFLNGQLQSIGTDFTETTPASGTFTFSIAPPTGSIIIVTYSVPAVTTGNFGRSIVTKTVNYTITSTDYTILVDATSTTITISLPAASSVQGMVFYVKKIDNTANAVTIDPNGSEVIDGNLTKSITTTMQTVHFQSNGTAWYIL